MRFFRVLASVICLLAAASAAEIKIKVVDPQSAVVAGAQVVLTFKNGSTPVAVANYIVRRACGLSERCRRFRIMRKSWPPDLLLRQPTSLPMLNLPP